MKRAIPFSMVRGSHTLFLNDFREDSLVLMCSSTQRNVSCCVGSRFGTRSHIAVDGSGIQSSGNGSCYYFLILLHFQNFRCLLPFEKKIVITVSVLAFDDCLSLQLREVPATVIKCIVVVLL